MFLLDVLRDSFSSPLQTFAHLSYLLLIVSMMMQSMLWLRILAVSSGLVEIAYRVSFLYDPVSIFWETLFISVNLLQLGLIWFQDRRHQFSHEERHFLESVCPQITGQRARKLLSIGVWHRAQPGTQLTWKGQMVPYLMFVSSGDVRVEVEGRVVGKCTKGDFLGEISFITEEPATADSFAATEVRYLAFERYALSKLLSAEYELAHTLESSFNRNLIEKLVKTNAGGPDSAAPQPAT